MATRDLRPGRSRGCRDSRRHDLDTASTLNLGGREWTWRPKQPVRAIFARDLHQALPDKLLSIVQNQYGK